MQLLRKAKLAEHDHAGSVVTIGNFDGVHLGHQLLLKQLRDKARELALPAIVVIFEPQPNEYFMGQKAPPRLMRLREKLLSIDQLNINRVICLHFNQQFAQLSALYFVQNILITGLRARYLLVGKDFRFGHQRRGDLALLQRCGQQQGFEVVGMANVDVEGQRVSSTRIRQALGMGDLATAQQLLGRPFFMSGRVAHGAKRGRILGFPTANIYLHRKAVPILGVYAVKVYGLQATSLYGVANVGNRPTVNGTRSLLEVHIFDFDREIYGRHVNVEFVHKLRDEKRFDSLDLLKQQIFRDAEEARKYFAL